MGRWGQDKVGGVLTKAQRGSEEASGTVVWTKGLVLKMGHAIGHLVHEREWGRFRAG
jgi:hypothetical protein